ncbi:hypothetical protein X737_37675 [Mesorhizobium sp. L48C026A00]|nr:hypothetical protein X737_37675 [Mesorhizobium sp. L48C026A00]
MSQDCGKIAGAEMFSSVEGDMCGADKRGAVALPGSRAIKHERNTSEPGISLARPGGDSLVGAGEEP